jgi:ribosomal protein L14E/L6E/L27E
MLSNEFKINEVDKCVYVKNIDKGYVIVCLYVDNMLILGNNNRMIKSIKKMLTNNFGMKDLHVILGI